MCCCMIAEMIFSSIEMAEQRVSVREMFEYLQNNSRYLREEVRRIRREVMLACSECVAPGPFERMFLDRLNEDAKRLTGESE